MPLPRPSRSGARRTLPGMSGVAIQHHEGTRRSHRTARLLLCLQPARVPRAKRAEGLHQLTAEYQLIRRQGDPLQDR